MDKEKGPAEGTEAVPPSPPSYAKPREKKRTKKVNESSNEGSVNGNVVVTSVASLKEGHQAQ